MENIFADIQAKLKIDVPEIVWIDIDEQQFEAFREAAPVAYPCVLIGFPGANYTNMGKNQQIAEVNVQLRVAFRVYERFNAEVPDTIKTAAFGHFAILRKVMKAIHGLSSATGHYNPLIRTSWTKDNSIDPKIYTVNYKCGLKDEVIGRQYAQLSLTDHEIELTINN